VVEAFEILAEQYRPMLVVYLRSLLRDADLAEDLTQETLIAAQRKLAAFHKGGNFGRWLRGIARNKALQNRRARSRRRIVADSRIVEGMEDVYSALDAPSAEAPEWRERLSRLRVCVKRLSGKLRASVEAVYQRGQSLREAAGSLGTNVQVIAQRVHRARQLLRECLSGGVPGEAGR
jgi:RNA polymerase sigma-70 factor (ECF subfamily)